MEAPPDERRGRHREHDAPQRPLDGLLGRKRPDERPAPDGLADQVGAHVGRDDRPEVEEGDPHPQVRHGLAVNQIRVLELAQEGNVARQPARQHDPEEGGRHVRDGPDLVRLLVRGLAQQAPGREPRGAPEDQEEARQHEARHHEGGVVLGPGQGRQDDDRERGRRAQVARRAIALLLEEPVQLPAREDREHEDEDGHRPLGEPDERHGQHDGHERGDHPQPELGPIEVEGRGVGRHSGLGFEQVEGTRNSKQLKPPLAFADRRHPPFGGVGDPRGHRGPGRQEGFDRDRSLGGKRREGPVQRVSEPGLDG
ncbi:hypothetical protein D3C86_1212220 [compost metagenome]